MKSIFTAEPLSFLYKAPFHIRKKYVSDFFNIPMNEKKKNKMLGCVLKNKIYIIF
jgi:hypothetical protein